MSTLAALPPRARVTPDGPTERQLGVRATIEILTAERGYAPTNRELCAELGISLFALHGHLAALRRHKLVTWEPRASRTLRLCSPSTPRHGRG